MKAAFITGFLFFISINLSGQEPREITVKTSVEEVSVFLESAQITRRKSLDLGAGTYLLKFTGLSPFIQSKSVQAKVTGRATLLSVNQQQNFLDSLKMATQIAVMETGMQDIRDQIQLLETQIDVTNEEIGFLNANRNIGGNEAINMVTLRDATNFYSQRLSSLKMKILSHQKEIRELREEEAKIRRQLNTRRSSTDYTVGEILVKVKLERPGRIQTELNYLVNNAGWYPSYDIRAKDISSPINLVYKANIKQDTKVDWNKVKIRLSTADPSLSGVKPELLPYYLNYSSRPPSYDRKTTEVSGVVRGSDGVTLPGANVIVSGTTIGTTADFNGRYSLALPSDAKSLIFSYIGYKSQTRYISGDVLNVVLQEDNQALQEVVVTGVGNKSRKEMSKRVAAGDVITAQEVADFDTSLPMQQVSRPTSVDFEIDIPYTVKSNNQTFTLDMANYALPVSYKYISVPKIEKAAYLIADVVNWEQYNLLEGEANLFFEGTFVGKSILDVRTASDTLQLSLGRDKNIVINREKKADFSSKKFVGTRKEERRHWEISIKNNKQVPVRLDVYDQIPVSTLDEIKVELVNRSKGKFNSENGEIKWELQIMPREQQMLQLEYLVKYPRNRRLYLE